MPLVLRNEEPPSPARDGLLECAAMSQRTPDALAGARRGDGEQTGRDEVSVRCPLCDADHYRVRYDSTLTEPIDPQRHYTSTSREFGRFGRIVECRSCGIVYMNPRPHHLAVQDAYGDVEDERYVEEEEGRVATFSESLDHVRRFAPAGRLLDVGCHVGTFIELAEERRLRGRGRRAVALGGQAGRGARARARARRRRRGRAAARGGLRRRHDVGRHRAPARPGQHAARRALGAAARRRLRGHDDGRRGALPARRRPPLALVHADAPRLLLAPHARRAAAPRAASRSSRSRVTAGSCASPTPCRAWAATAARRSASRAPLTRRLGDRTVGVDLGDIVTVVARKPAD